MGVLTAFSGCRAMPTGPAVTAWDFDAEIETVWQAALETAEAMRLDVARADSGTDTITTRWQPFHRGERFADCPGALPDSRLLMRHTIRVRPAGAAATLQIDSQFQMQRNSGAGPSRGCPTTGEFERRFHDRVARLVQRAGREG
ncbi:MAG: hypothetical protein D6693_06320 [Planctomycetota bacterium]|nr:MAG: hypothetical protein D6693_06320 [Planctomycetota bacterium]